jgi:hypothetical protein
LSEQILDEQQEVERKAPKTFDELKVIAESYGLTIPLESPFTPNDLNKVAVLFRLPIDEDAIQVSKGSETRRGYDTTGYSYQSHVDRMNFVLGPTHWKWQVMNEVLEEGTTSSNKVKYMYSGEIELSIGYRQFYEDTGRWEWVEVHSISPIPTDHESLEKGSARKGMLTKGIKRATSFLGVGADAYLGVLDDDMTTGAGPEDDMATPRYKSGVAWEDQQILEHEYKTLVKFAARKGLTTDERLREFYKTKSEGKIENPPATLTKGELKKVNSFLAKSPDATPKQEQPKPQEQTEPGQAEQEIERETSKRPTTLTELLSSPDELIRQLATEYSFQLPAQINERNKGPLCKTLGQLMGLK